MIWKLSIESETSYMQYSSKAKARCITYSSSVSPNTDFGTHQQSLTSRPEAAPSRLVSLGVTASFQVPVPGGEDQAHRDPDGTESRGNVARARPGKRAKLSRRGIFCSHDRDKDQASCVPRQRTQRRRPPLT